MEFRSLPIGAIPLLLAGALSAQGAVHVVDASGGGDFTEIHHAIAAAAEGDCVLVRAGVYDHVRIDGKSLTVIADVAEGEQVRVEGLLFDSGAIRVRNLGPNQRVTIRGIDIVKLLPYPFDVVEITECEGKVWIEDCHLTPGSITTPIFGTPEADAVVTIERADAVLFTGCTIVGEDGRMGGTGKVPANGAIRAIGSTVAIYDCTLSGGDGLGAFSHDFADEPGGRGANAVEVKQCALFVSGSTLTGGDGGEGLHEPMPCLASGDGGDGLQVQGTLSVVHRLGGTFVGGAAGLGPPTGCSPDGVDGLGANVLAGSLTDLASTPRSASAQSPVRENQAATIAYAGLPGDLVLALVGTQEHALTLPFFGVLAAQPLAIELLGTADAVGQLSVDVPIQPFPSPTTQVATAYIQVLGVGLGGGPPMPTLGGPTALTLLDEGF